MSRVVFLDLESLRRCLVSIPEVDFAYLFGSFARGHAHPESDVDIAVRVKDGVLDRRSNMLAGLFPALSGAVASHRLDLVILNEAPILLQHKVLEEGRLVYCRDRGVWAEFFVRICDEYADWLPMLEPHIQATRGRILEGKSFGQPGDFERSLARARDVLGKT